MNDRRKQIPIGCAVNVAIINEISNTETFKKACIEVPLKFGMIPPQENSPWPFFNISWGSYMMYSHFVVAKELYNLQNDDEFFQSLIAKNAMQDFNVLKEKHSFNDQPLYHFKSFRNAISHVNYTVDDNSIKLWDHPPSKNEPENWHWEVEISNDNFLKFLGLVNESNFIFYNEINSGKLNQDGIIV
jgi:hypothetical protein